MYHSSYRKKKKNQEKVEHKETFFDYIMYLVAFVAPLMTIPQLQTVWIDKQTDGVSLATWGGFGIISILWAIYGFRNKQKPVILTNTLLSLANFLVVIGVLLYR